MDFIDLKKQQKLIRKNVDDRISKVLNHGQYILGPEVKELEKKLRENYGFYWPKKTTKINKKKYWW